LFSIILLFIFKALGEYKRREHHRSFYLGLRLGETEATAEEADREEICVQWFN